MRVLLVIVVATLAPGMALAQDEAACSVSGMMGDVRAATSAFNEGLEAISTEEFLSELSVYQQELERIQTECGGEPDFMIYVWEARYGDGQTLMVSAASAFLDVDEYDMDVVLRADPRSETYCLTDMLFGGDPPIELGCSMGDEIRKDDVSLITITVGGLFDDRQHFRCDKSEAGKEVDTWSCQERR